MLLISKRSLRNAWHTSSCCTEDTQRLISHPYTHNLIERVVYDQTATLRTSILFAASVVAAAPPPSVATAVPVSDEMVSFRFRPVGWAS